MEVINSGYIPSSIQAHYLIKDRGMDSSGYRADRGMAALMQLQALKFDIYGHLHQLEQKISPQRVEVLEGGCGCAAALIDLKKGLTVGWETNSDINPDYTLLLDYLNNQTGYRQVFNGLGDRIRTTGVTLSLEHARVAALADSTYQPDRMFISPIDQCDFNQEFDFIYDCLGPAWHFPEEAFPVYGRALKVGCYGYLELPPGKDHYRAKIAKLLLESNLRIVDSKTVSVFSGALVQRV